MLRRLFFACAWVAATGCCLKPVQDYVSTSSGGTSGATTGGSSGGTSGGIRPGAPASVMIVQDLSGSMCHPIHAAAPDGTSCLSTNVGVGSYCSVCEAGDGTCTDPTDCQTHAQASGNAVTSALAALNLAAGQLSVGMTTFPSGNDCSTGEIRIGIGDAVANLPQIVELYKAAQPSGGGPMVATLEAAAADPALASTAPNARKFIVLVTNGWPNCASTSACTSELWSDGVAHGCVSPNELVTAGSAPTPPAGCTCSFGPCNDPPAADCCPIETTGSQEATYCLDDVNTAAELSSLYTTQGITTYIVAASPDFFANTAVLNELAAAGHGSPTPFVATSPAALQAFFHELIATDVPDAG